MKTCLLVPDSLLVSVLGLWLVKLLKVSAECCRLGIFVSFTRVEQPHNMGRLWRMVRTRERVYTYGLINIYEVTSSAKYCWD